MSGKGRYSLGKSARDGFDKRDIPGPGTYSSKLANSNGKITFSRDNKFKQDVSKTPGPGQY